MTIPPLHWLADYFPSDATAVKGHARPKQHLDIPQSQPSIGATTRGNIPLPRGHAPSGVGIGDDGSNLLDLVTTAAKKAHTLARTVGGPLNPIAPAEDAIAYGFQKGKEAGEKVQNSQYGSALGAAGVTAANAGMFALPEAKGVLSKLMGKSAAPFERFAVLTGENPGGRAASAAENTARNASLEAELVQRGYSGKYARTTGVDVNPASGETLNENSFLVPNMPEREAKLLAQRFGQTGVLTHNGYHDLSSGQLYPATAIREATGNPKTVLPNGKAFQVVTDMDNPVKSPVNTLPVPKGGNPEILRLADEMRAASGGTKMPRVNSIDPEKARYMAQVYEALPKNQPEAKDAYDALNNEVAAQYQALQDAGFKFQYTDSDPYKNSTEMMNDVRQNRTLKVFKTPSDNFHPYMTPEQNDQLRAVHDALAHAGEGNQFGPKGEENAYRVHAATLSPLAQQALATETRGQNSWVNFGPNAHLPVGQRPFAEQKAALWPADLLGDYDSFLTSKNSLSTQGHAALDAQAAQKAAEQQASQDFKGGIAAHITPTSELDAARASARQAPTDMEIPLNPRAAMDSVVSRAAPAVLTAPNTGDVFDTSKLGLDVPAGVSTDRPPLKRPTRADLSSLSNVPRKMREVYTPNVEKAIRDTPEAGGWYDMTQVRDAMKDLSPTGGDDFKKLMLFMGPTSIGTKVPDNLRQASMFYKLWKNGELSLDDLQNGTLDLPQGYSNRRQKSVNAGISKILTQGNLDPYTTPKTYRYANQLAGDMWGGAALDMHVGRQVGQRGLMPQPGGLLEPDTGFPTPGYTKDNPIVSSSPSDTQYAHIEDKLVNQAQNLGLTPSQYQALGWVGGGAQTGVSDTRPLLSIFNDKLRSTAAKYGFNSPLDAFTAFAQGKTPLWAMLPAAALGGGLLSGNDQQR